MSKINLNLILSVVTADGPKSVGSVFGLPVLMFNVPGRVWQGMIHGGDVDTPMRIGDELKEAVFRQQLTITRDGDAHSMDLYQAYQQGKKFLVLANVVLVDSSGGATSSATLTIKSAKMTQFKRKNLGGILTDKQRDSMRFSFTTGNTELGYVGDINAAMTRAVGQIMTAISGPGK